MIMVIVINCESHLAGVYPRPGPDVAPGALPVRGVLGAVRRGHVRARDPQPPRAALLQAVLHRRRVRQVPPLQQVGPLLLTALGITEVVITYFPRVIPRPITDKALRALDHSWHVACFVCKVITNWTKNIPFKLGKNNSFNTRNVECLLKGRRISTQLTVTQCVESVSVQGRQSEQINSYTRMFVKFRETILVTGECQTNIYRSIILF